MKEVPEIVKQAVQRLVVTLGAHGQFKIILNDGTEFGDLQVAVKHSIVRRKVNFGLTDYIRPYLDNIKAGEVAVVPATPLFPTDALSSSTTALCSKRWGNGTYQSMTNKHTGNIEVLRLS